jgi:hypothetical protein
MKTDRKRAPREMRSEYDFSSATRGKYHQQYSQGTNLVLLEPDVAEAFPDSQSVNRALRLLVDVAKRRRSNKALQRTAASRGGKPVKSRSRGGGR